jgi:hypothetical protein
VQVVDRGQAALELFVRLGHWEILRGSVLQGAYLRSSSV